MSGSSNSARCDTGKIQFTAPLTGMARHTATFGGEGWGGKDMVVEMRMWGRSGDGGSNYLGAMSEHR